MMKRARMIRTAMAAAAALIWMPGAALAYDRVEPTASLTRGSVAIDGFTNRPIGLDRICVPGYATAFRKGLDRAYWRETYDQYGVPYVRGGYENDHLISIELGGSNELPYLHDAAGRVRYGADGRPLPNPLSNLWPEPYHPANGWGARVKDTLENRLHDLVCQANPPLSLEEAQRAIATDWIAAYRKYVGPTQIEFHAREGEGYRSRRRRESY